MVEMLYQGHGSYRFVVDGRVVVYVDPYAGKPEWYELPADLILVTHEHFDHTAIDLMPHAQGCEVFRAADVHPTPEVYLTLASHGVRFTGVQAYNRNHPVDECVGFVIDFGDLTFYAAGDTSTTDDMSSGKLASLGIDYAALPGDGIFNMDIAEASACARMVDARHTIPVHLEPVSPADDGQPEFPEDRAAAFTGPGKIVVRPGETITLQPVS